MDDDGETGTIDEVPLFVAKPHTDYWIWGARGLTEAHGCANPPPAKHCLFAYGIGWFCGACGDLWARRVCWDPVNRKVAPFVVYSSRCERCPTQTMSPPGSIWSTLDNGEISVLPLPVLLRELQLHMDFYERL